MPKLSDFEKNTLEGIIHSIQSLLANEKQQSLAKSYFESLLLPFSERLKNKNLSEYTTKIEKLKAKIY